MNYQFGFIAVIALAAVLPAGPVIASSTENSIPAAIVESLDFLSEQGLLAPDREESFKKRPMMSRSDVAAVVAKASLRWDEILQDENLQHLHQINTDSARMTYDQENKQKIKKTLLDLQKEMKPELETLGFFKTQEIMQQSRAGKRLRSDLPDKRLKIDGEVRWSYANNRGEDRFNYDNSRLRTRVYFDYNIDNNWHGHTMIESDKSLAGQSDKDGKPTFERGYIDGYIGTGKLTAGSFSYLMGEGNIYDSSYDGIAWQIQGPVQYTVANGRSDNFKRSTLFTAHYDDPDYSLDAGVHYFRQNDEQNNTIISLGGNYKFEQFGLGLMLLHSTLHGGNGGVLTLTRGKLKSWQPGSYSLWAKYYNQGAGTYILHTMTGLADSMNGFTGYAIGGSRTLFPNIIADLEYYDLQDKQTHERGKTIWFDIRYYFSAG